MSDAPGATPVPLEQSTGFRRLHPLSPIFNMLSGLRQMVFLLLFAGISSNAIRIPMLIVMSTVILVLPTLRYLRFGYRLGREELVVRQGLLVRHERRIPYDKIQNIDLVRNPLHRALSVADARIETATGGSAEAVLQVLSLPAVEELRSIALGRSGATEESRSPGTSPGGVLDRATDRGRELLELSTGELVKLGLISNRGLVAVGAGLAFLTQFDDLVWTRLEAFANRVDWDTLPAVQWLASLRETLSTGGPSIENLALGLVTALVLVLVVVLPAVYLLSIALAIFRFHGFQLRRHENDLRSEYGLFTRISLTVPRARIQRLWSIENPIHRWLGRTTLRMATAGGSTAAGSGSRGQSSRQWLAPICPSERVAELLSEAQPQALPLPSSWHPISSRAQRRLTRRGLLRAALFAILVAVFTGNLVTLLVFLPLAVWSSIRARLFVRHHHYGRTAEAIYLRAGWWTRRTWIVRLGKIQSVSIHQSPFDRRRAMAHLSIDTAGPANFPALVIPYLDQAIAEGLADELHQLAHRHDFVWS
jgi:putative membrane protein